MNQDGRETEMFFDLHMDNEVGSDEGDFKTAPASFHVRCFFMFNDTVFVVQK